MKELTPKLQLFLDFLMLTVELPSLHLPLKNFWCPAQS